jgi:hypothetical protein
MLFIQSSNLQRTGRADSKQHWHQIHHKFRTWLIGTIICQSTVKEPNVG